MARKKSLRPSRDERSPYIDAISEALAEGRIDEAEQFDRVELVETATSFDDLDALVDDIPFEWHDKELAKAKRVERRSFILGSAGVLLVGAASWAATRTWVDAAADEPAGDGAEAPSGSETPKSEPASSETGSADDEVPTELVQVEAWTKQAMPTAMDFVESVGMVTVAEVSGSGDFFRVEGLAKKRKPLSVTFSKDRRPEVEEVDLVAEKTISSDSLRDLDLAKLLAEAKKETGLGESVDEVSLLIRYWPKMWTIEVRDSEADVYWRLEGMKRWDPDTDWPTG